MLPIMFAQPYAPHNVCPYSAFKGTSAMQAVVKACLLGSEKGPGYKFQSMVSQVLFLVNIRVTFSCIWHAGNEPPPC